MAKAVEINSQRRRNDQPLIRFDLTDLLTMGVFPADLAADPAAIDLDHRFKAHPETWPRTESTLGFPGAPRSHLANEFDWESLRWLLSSHAGPPPTARPQM